MQAERDRLTYSSRQRATGEGREAGRVMEVGRQNQKQSSLMMAEYEAKHVADKII
jgi:hypothetical protein